MNKHLIITALAGLSLLPLAASAQTLQVKAEGGTATEAQLLTACSQTSIEIRDSAIGSARTAYNNTMAIALDMRKEAEKRAVAIEDAAEKKEAIKVAVEDYKKAVTHAQESLTKARKEAWAAFEANTKGCREGVSPERTEMAGAQFQAATHVQSTMMRKEAAPTAPANEARAPQARMMQASVSQDTAVTASVATQAQITTEEEKKSFKEVIVQSIKSLFKRGE